MKKSAKLISLLLVLTLLLGIIPMAVAADTTFAIGTTELIDAKLERGAVSSYKAGVTKNASATKSIGESGFQQTLPYTTYKGYDYSPVNYIIPENGVQVSKTGIIGDFKIMLEMAQFDGWEGSPALQFEYTAQSAGTVTVTLTYYYNYGLYYPGTTIYYDNNWYKGTMTFKVTVNDNEVPAPTKPGQPTENDLYYFRNYVSKKSTSKGAVYMWCAAKLNEHGAWFSHLSEVPGAYSLGEVTANDGSVRSNVLYPWVCPMTIDANKYLDAYNYELSGECGTHYLEKDEPETQTVIWYYNAYKETWEYRSSEAPIYIDITHTAPTPSVTEYTVTYTDGVDGAAFADQTYTVKEGDATPAFDGTPAREGYVFLGWEPEVAETVTDNATYTAKWEEALTEVKVTSTIGEGALLFLGSEFKVTATANTDANLTFAFEANPAFKQITSSSTSNSKTVWYRVVKITGGYTKINVSVTGTKGTQTPVTGSLSFGVNLRNRIHVTVKTTSGEVIDNVTNIKLNHKYPQWNACPALKYDAAKKEYVMQNAWDLSNQEFVSVSFEYDGETYTTNVTKDGESLFDVIRAGEKEIYVEYVIVDPIYLTIEVDGETVVDNEKYKGQKDEKMDYSQKLKEVQQNLLAENKTMISLATYVDGQLITEKYTPLFGTNKTVKIVIMTNA